MLDHYLAEVARGASEIDFNRLHITLETHLAPAELRALVDGVRARGPALPEHCRLWLKRTDTFLAYGGLPVQPYERRVLADGVNAYAAPGTPEERARRTLVIAFTGDSFRLMLPIGIFLQHCPADRYEFLLLFDRRKCLYLRGIDGLTRDMAGTFEWIAANVPLQGFGRVVSFGVSAGGMAAVWTAIGMRLARGVSVGGTTPDSAATRYQTQGVSADGFMDAVRRNEGHLPEVLLVAGADCERDREKAQAMSQRVPATIVLAPGVAKHNVIAELWTRHELVPFLERLLGSSGSEQPSTGDPAAAPSRAPAAP
ncbi:hypothetical protein BURK1_00110 [Burkholderiales bacterium]|nr:hypothetical protein BURK1_00110 [Burkholderiales bacterium]